MNFTLPLAPDAAEGPTFDHVGTSSLSIGGRLERARSSRPRRIAPVERSSTPSDNGVGRAEGPEQLEAVFARRADDSLDARITHCPDATLTTTMTAYLDAYRIGIRAPDVTLHNGWAMSCGPG